MTDINQKDNHPLRWESFEEAKERRERIINWQNIPRTDGKGLWQLMQEQKERNEEEAKKPFDLKEWVKNYRPPEYYIPNFTYYCDNNRHLVCTPYSRRNLHLMAQDLEIKKHFFHKDHYDIPKRRIKEITDKCILVSSKEIVKIIKDGEIR